MLLKTKTHFTMILGVGIACLVAIFCSSSASAYPAGEENAKRVRPLGGLVDVGAAGAQPLVEESATATATPSPTCGVDWRVQSSPNLDSHNNYLTGIAVISADDIWSVGYSTIPFSPASQALILHYTNGEWQVVPGPVTGGAVALWGIAAVSADDIWAVGTWSNNVLGTITFHYTNGQWQVVSTPHVGDSTTPNYLLAVSAASANDVWAVGYYTVANLHRTLTLHYANGQWQVVPSPNVSEGSVGNGLMGVKALSADDVWAVGFLDSAGHGSSLTMHYTNGAWQVVSSPDVGALATDLYAVDAIAPGDVWAVGQAYNSPQQSQTLTIHYTNGGWQVVPSPSVGVGRNQLKGIAALADNDVWAVGSYTNNGASTYSLIMHYINGVWQVVPSPNVGTGHNVLAGIAAVSPTDIWAAGHYQDTVSLEYKTLVLHQEGTPCPTTTPQPAATATATQTVQPTSTVAPSSTTAAASTSTAVLPSATAMPATSTVAPSHTPMQPTATSIPVDTATPSHAPTNTPVQPTGTSIQPTSTPGVATATPCRLQYTDVPTDSTFYPFVRCLACRGIISGYECGGDGEPCDSESNPYFRPNAKITRGQIAKIVSNSAGYDEDPNPQIYEDVDPTNTFYQWINRLSRRGHMGGYLCGTVPNEPCNSPDNHPYFRPFNNATRAQPG